MSAPSMVGAEEVGLSFGAFGEDISRERGAKEPHSSIDFVYCTHMCFQLFSLGSTRQELVVPQTGSDVKNGGNEGNMTISIHSGNSMNCKQIIIY